MKEQLQSVQELLKTHNSLDQGRYLLHEILRQDGIQHVTYGALRVNNAPQNRLSSTSYPQEWQELYIHKNYVNEDPIVLEGLKRTMPFNWAELRPASKEFFGISKEFGICDQGLSIPVYDHNAGFGLLSISSEMPRSLWRTFCREYEPFLMLAAHHFHGWATKPYYHAMPSGYGDLNDNEQEVLHWVAAGKELQDIAVILNTKERTIKYRMQRVREKLNAVSQAHAVAKAMRIGMIFH